MRRAFDAPPRRSAFFHRAAIWRRPEKSRDPSPPLPCPACHPKYRVVQKCSGRVASPICSSTRISGKNFTRLCMAGWEAEADFGFALEMRLDSGSSGRCTSFRGHERDGVERIRKSRHEFLW